MNRLYDPLCRLRLRMRLADRYVPGLHMTLHCGSLVRLAITAYCLSYLRRTAISALRKPAPCPSVAYRFQSSYAWEQQRAHARSESVSTHDWN